MGQRRTSAKHEMLGQAPQPGQEIRTSEARVSESGESEAVAIQKRIIILMGVMGCGKTTVGKLLADQLGCAFFDADDFHPAANRKKMAAGEPLSELDRQPWLRALRESIKAWLVDGRTVVLACSALRQSYRDILSADPQQVSFVFLTGAKTLLMQRVSARSGHFMPASLLESQLNTLEPPEGVLTLDVKASPLQLVDSIICDLKD